MPFIEVDDSSIAAVLEKEFAKMRTVILRFGSSWCRATRTLEHELEEVYKEIDNLAVLMIDTDQSPEVTGQYNVRLVPTVVILKNRGEVLYRGEGVMTAHDIVALIED